MSRNDATTAVDPVDWTQLPVFDDNSSDAFDTEPLAPTYRFDQRPDEVEAAAVSSRGLGEPSRGGEEFWSQVDELRKVAGDRLASALEGREGVSAQAREELGRSIIEDVIRDRTDSLIVGGAARWDTTRQAELKSAVFDALFRMGRLQPLMDDATVENIKIQGHDRVYVVRTTGGLERVGPVASSNEDLVQMLQDLAARQEDRTFTRSTPMLDLPLPDRARMAATGWITADGVPNVTIRMQRLRDATLSSLIQVGEIDRVLANFLSSAVRAHCSLVVSGQSQGSGKTTMLRALANEIPPYEAIATIETEPELYLHEDIENHPLVNSYIARRGSGERDAMGRRVGEITTLDILPSALRHNISRIIVGEVRHHTDLDAMLEAMQMGNGSLSTLHANSADLVLSRLVRMATYATGSPEAAQQEIGDVIDLVVYLGQDRDPKTGRLHRYVRDVAEVAYSADAGRAITKPVFAPGQGRRAVPAHLPSPQMLARLVEGGFNQELFTMNPAGLWGDGL
ncbi:CpaF family protein [Pseudactinotalea sp. Z1748]|uniref:CpaF family protein n=1 Tax=Pseudactinotalea sp. Z1748 TaxID=3413027 RepID=UPI003C7B5B23